MSPARARSNQYSRTYRGLMRTLLIHQPGQLMLVSLARQLGRVKQITLAGALEQDRKISGPPKQDRAKALALKKGKPRGSLEAFHVLQQCLAARRQGMRQSRVGAAFNADRIRANIAECVAITRIDLTEDFLA